MNRPMPRLAIAFALSLIAHAFALSLIAQPVAAHANATSVLYSQLFAAQGGQYAPVN